MGGDAVFLKLLLSDEQRFFTIKLRYEGDKLIEKMYSFIKKMYTYADIH